MAARNRIAAVVHQCLCTAILVLVACVPLQQCGGGVALAGRSFTVTATAASIGARDVCIESNSNSPLTTFLRYPRAVAKGRNGTYYITTTTSAGFAALRVALPNGTSFTHPSTIFSSTSTSVIGLSLLQDERVLLLVSNAREVSSIVPMRGTTATVVTGSSSASGATVVTGSSSASGAVLDGTLSTARFLNIVGMSVLQSPSNAIAGAFEQVLMLADANVVRLVNLSSGEVTTICGQLAVAASIDGVCNARGALDTLSALAVADNSTHVVVFIVQFNTFLRRVSAQFGTPMDQTASWIVSTIGSSGILNSGTIVSMVVVKTETVLSVVYSSGEGIILVFTPGSGIQRVGSVDDGYACGQDGAVGVATFKKPVALAVAASSLDASLSMVDGDCCAMSTLSGTFNMTDDVAAQLNISTASHFRTSNATLTSYSTINGACNDGNVSGVWAFVVDGSKVVLMTDTMETIMVSSGAADLLNCVIVRHNASATIAYFPATTSFVVYAFDILAKRWLGDVCGRRTYGTASGTCSQATFTALGVASAGAIQLSDRGSPPGFYIGDGNLLRYITVIASVSNVTTLGSVQNSGSIVGIAFSDTHIYVAHLGTYWCSRVARSVVQSAYAGSTSAAVMAVVARWTYYFSPATASVGFAYHANALYLSTNGNAEFPRVIVRIPIDANGDVVMSLLRRVAGSDSDVMFLRSDATRSPLSMALSSVQQMSVSGDALIVTDATHKAVWRLDNGSPHNAAPGGNAVAHTTKTHSLEASASLTISTTAATATARATITATSSFSPTSSATNTPTNSFQVSRSASNASTSNTSQDSRSLAVPTRTWSVAPSPTASTSLTPSASPSNAHNDDTWSASLSLPSLTKRMSLTHVGISDSHSLSMWRASTTANQSTTLGSPSSTLHATLTLRNESASHVSTGSTTLSPWNTSVSRLSTASLTYVPPPPPTVAPKIAVCSGDVQVVLSYNVSRGPVVVSLTTALSAAFVFTIQLSSCHTFVAPLTAIFRSRAGGGGVPPVSSVVAQAISLQQKRLTIVVGPLYYHVTDTTKDLVLDLIPPTNRSLLFLPDTFSWVHATTLNAGGGNGTDSSSSSVVNETLPGLTVTFAAQEASLAKSAYQAMQAGVASVSVITVVVSSPALAGSAQRQALLSNVANCPDPMNPVENTLPFSSHPMQFPLGWSVARFYSGSAVGDVTIMVVVVVVHSAATLGMGKYYSESFFTASWRTRFPMHTAPVLAVLSQPALSGALVTLYYNDEAGLTVVAVVVLVTICLGLGWYVHRVFAMQGSEARFAEKPTIRAVVRAALAELKERKEWDRRLSVVFGTHSAVMRLERADAQVASEAGMSKHERQRSYSSVERTQSWWSRCLPVLQSWTRTRGVWVPVNHPHTLCSYGPAFEENDPRGFHFLLVDTLQNVVSVAILSYVPTTNDGCRDQFAAVLLVLTSYAMVLLVVRPYLSAVANLIACWIAVLQSLAAWALFIAFQLDSSEWMLVYTCLNLATVGVQVIAAVHGGIKLLVEIKVGKDQLSRGLTFWSALDSRGAPFLRKFYEDKALAHWPALDPIIQYKLQRGKLAQMQSAGFKPPLYKVHQGNPLHPVATCALPTLADYDDWEALPALFAVAATAESKVATAPSIEDGNQRLLETLLAGDDDTTTSIEENDDVDEGDDVFAPMVLRGIDNRPVVPSREDAADVFLQFVADERVKQQTREDLL